MLSLLAQDAADLPTKAQNELQRLAKAITRLRRHF
jgi:hypothetical protein